MHKKYIFLIAGVLGVFFYAWFIRAPFNFPTNEHIVIPKGSTVQEVGSLLEEKKVISSSALFTVIARYLPQGGVQAGIYVFDRPAPLFTVLSRLQSGETGLAPLRVTFPEGSSVREMANILQATVPEFDVAAFREKARAKEGYLFPDTYVVPPGISPDVLITLMEENFATKIADLEPDIAQSGKTLEEIIIMASLLEKEARQYETSQIVAGILWKRLSVGMPLQVDAVFGYILDRDTFSPTFDQLVEIDSPYNTYRNNGLPPGAINNPGLQAIRATLYPIETPYWYYLTGFDGTMYYARTFDEHVANRRFLRAP
jgi:UPF0755 protein